MDKDSEIYKLLVFAVTDGLKALKKAINEKAYISSQFNWYSVNIEENGFPNFYSDPYSDHPQYSSAFALNSKNTDRPINIEDIPSFLDFRSFCKNNSNALGYYLPKTLYDKKDKLSIEFIASQKGRLSFPENIFFITLYSPI